MLVCLSLLMSVHATTVGTNVRITPSTDTAFQAEVAVALNPSNDASLVAGYMTMVAQQFQLAHARSTDRGATWQNNALFSLSGFNKFVDPSVGFNVGGTPYFVGLAESSAVCVTDDKSSCNASLVISKSADSGTTWTALGVFKPATCSNGVGTFHDKPDMKVDTGSSSPNIGKIFVSWTRFDACPIAGAQLPPTSVMLARLTDTGSGFTQDLETRVAGASGGTATTQIMWNDVAIAPNGDVYVGWAQITKPPAVPIAQEAISVAKSSDGGQTFTTLSVPSSVNGPVFDALHPLSFEIEVDPGAPSNIYLVYEDSSANSGDVMFKRSTNGGTGWSLPLTVNSNTAFIQSFPTMSVVAGRIDIIWYDGRNSPSNLQFDVFYAKSLDGGQSFYPDIQINSASVPTTGPALGDYIGMSSSRYFADTVWTGGLPQSSDIRDPIFALLSDLGTGIGGGGGSVAYGTLIIKADGTRMPVQNLAVGDNLLMYDVYSRTSITATLTSIPRTTVDNMLTIYTENGMPLRVDANPRLRFYVWTTAGPTLKPVTEFRAGDLIYNYDLAKWVTITRIQTSSGGNHTYYDLLTDPYLTADGHFLNFIANGYADPCNPICKEGPGS